ncbi:MAG: hypothetical protein ACOH17_04405 [Cellulomonas sp.]
MIPTFDVEVEVESVGPNMSGLASDLRMRGWVANSAFVRLRPGDWDAAVRAVTEEALIISEADSRSTTTQEFERLVQDAEDGASDADWAGFDAGVAGLVFALNAAGFVTATSCRKHVDDPYGHYPHVIAACDAQRFRQLLPLVVEDGAGISDEPSGGFGLYGPTVEPMMRLAALLVAHSSEFEALPETVPWEEDPDDPDGDAY